MKFAGTAFIFALLLVPAGAQAKKYSFDVPEKLVNIQFESQMEVEDILGTTSSVKGGLEIDARNKGSFGFSVPVDSLKTGISMRDDHLKSPMWLDAAKYPEIKFEGSGIRHVSGSRYEVTGKFTLHGVSVEKKVEVRAQEIEGERAKRLGLAQTSSGTWLRIRGSFKVKLSEHGVKIPGMAAAKVSDEWSVKVSLFAKESR